MNLATGRLLTKRIILFGALFFVLVNLSLAVD